MIRTFLTLLCAVGFILVTMGQKNDADVSIKETLLVSGTTHYILLTENSAYFMFRRYDKPSFFTAFDTLSRKSDKLYQSVTKDLIIKDKRYCLILKNTPKKKNRIIFHSVNEKELLRWNYAHNIDEVNGSLSPK